MTEFLRMSGIYWGVTAIDLMHKLDRLDRKSIVEFIKKCQCQTSGGISPCDGHDPHILYTLSAVQVNLLLLFVCSPFVNVTLSDSVHIRLFG
jgi:geranylgeranyl transferase type-2 subunit beta